MKKGVVFSFTMLILIVLAFSSASASDISTTKRHVAMVYDDSTSMYISDVTDKPVLNWSYANYMTQAFLALLNSQDSFYLTYMSDTEKDNVTYDNLLESDRAEAIEAIREKNDYINKTPFQAVETAYNMLKNLDEDLTDEYWLVIVTDGAFTAYEGDVTETLTGYIDEMAQLGKTLKVVFLAIGEDANPPEENEDKGLLVYQTELDGIVATMASLADNISGRHNVSTSKMNELSGNRLSVDLLLPVRSLIVFNQSDGNTLNDISNSEEDAMSITEVYNIEAPESFDYEDDTQMLTDSDAVGTITRIEPENEGDILSDGRYILSFEDAVNTSNIRVMYEPAIDIKIQYYKDGKPVESPEDGSVCDIEVQLINSLTGNELDSGALPEEVNCTIQILKSGVLDKTADGFIIEDVELVSGDTSIVTEIEMTGYFTLRSREDYIADEITEAEATPVPVEYDETAGPWPPEVELLIETTDGQTFDLKLLEEYEPICVTPLFNGEKGDLSDLQMGSFNVYSSRKIEFEVVVDEVNMCFLIYPKYYSDVYSTSTGLIDLQIYFQSEYDKVAETMLVLTVNDLTWLQRNYRIIAIPFAALIIAVAILGILVFRKKFAKGAWLEFTQMHLNRYDEWVSSKAPSSVTLNNLKGRWKMIPFAPERTEISNVMFYPANDEQAVMIPKKSLTANMGTTKGMLTQEELKKDFYLQSGFRLFLENGKHRIVFVYHAPKRSLLNKKRGGK